MFDQRLLKLNTAVADGLKSIKVLKKLAVQCQAYEYSAKLRDIEKLLENAETAASYLDYPANMSRLKDTGKLPCRQLFTYANANNWDIAPIFINAFKQRKTELNKVTKFSDDDTGRLINLNRLLSIEESKIANFIKYVGAKNAVNNSCNDSSANTILIKCYTHDNKYINGPENSAHQQCFSFYRFTLLADKLLHDAAGYYRNYETSGITDQDIFKSLPLKFHDEQTCFLFSNLITSGLLAWADLLMVTKIEIDLDVRYKFSMMEDSP